MQRGIESAAGVREGDVLAGKYRVERVLGVGGMGVVVSAVHTHLDTKVAIKFLLPEMLASRDAVVRFAKEARAAVKITSEHVARVFDVGVLDNGAPYMVMEFLEGEDLSHWVKQRGPLPVEQAAEFVLQACVAVADAHHLGIVHRDLKPANLFCVRRSDGQLIIKVLDFGISKTISKSASGPVSVTQTSALMGSPLYMSPEQMRSAKNVDAQTDIWSLGVILFELLTGQTPFDGDTLSLVAIRVATESAPPLRTLRPDAPADLEAVIGRCLEKDPKARYADIGDLAAALQRFAPERSRGSVERIAGIVQSSRASLSDGALPPPIVAPTLLSGRPPELELVAQTAQTADPVGGTVMKLPVARARGLILAAVAVAAAAVVGVAFAWRAPSHTALPPAATSTAPATPVASLSPEPNRAEEAPPLPPPTTTSAMADPPPDPATTPAPARPSGISGAASNPGTHAPKAKPATSAVATPVPVAPKAPAPGHSASTTVSCDPPYYFDPNGTRVFKKECL
jgi:serine/threonine-protein kinase